ncbi:hypothetical protein [Brachybacterium sp.]|uniref:hypothetical protein n=1 Tax=Brachybacterium sp. TaxID=1891286 RepID=UPI002ED2A405
MRTTPYPVPPSRSWTVTALLTYGALALAGGIVLYVVASSGQPIEGWVVLGIWGGLTFPSALACVWGVARDRYRWEWMGCWGIVMGTSVYLAVTAMGVLAADTETIIASAPTLLFFVYGLGRTLGRAIVLSLIDLEARRRVVATRTGEIPEVPVDEY